MKSEDIKPGTVYAAKITDKVVPVRLDSEHPAGGWNATNLATRKTVRIKSPRKLRGAWTGDIETATSSATTASTGTPPVGEKPKGASKVKGASGSPTKPTRGRTAAKASSRGSRGSKGTSGAGGSGGSSGGVLEAAVTVMRDAKTPLGTKEMIDRILERKLWQTQGATPAATLYSAIHREIQRKGKDACFRKVERGKFELVRKG